MTTNKKKPMGRRPKFGVAMTKKVEIRFTDDQFEQVLGKAGIQDLADYGRDAILAIVNRTSQEANVTPVLGYIPASPASEVVHLPPGTTVKPPFKLGDNCYGLIVIGDSMTSADGLSIPDGSYAFFCPDITPFFGAIVHVEWPQNEDGGEHFCTLKRYCPQPDGRTVYFEPLNKRHKRIVKKEGEFVIRGVFSRAWDGK